MGISGYVVLGIATVFFLYLMPQLIRSRQDVVDSRAEDRYSADLRILATAGSAGPASRPVPDDGAPRAYLHNPRLRTEVSAMNRPPALVSRPGPAQPAGPGGAPTTRPDTPANRARAAVGADAARRRRAAAARRRLVLTLTMLAMSVGAWVAVGLGVTVPLVAAIPSAMLALVLLLGRRAVAAGRRAERAAARPQPARQAAAPNLPEPARLEPARPESVRPASVRPASVRSASARPEAARAESARDDRTAPEPSRVAASAAGAALGDGSAPPGREAPSRDAVTELIPRLSDRGPGSSLRWSGEPTEANDRLDVVPAAAARPGTSDPAGTSWTPVPVPAPTYTLKPTAPRLDAPPLIIDRRDGAESGREVVEGGDRLGAERASQVSVESGSASASAESEVSAESSTGVAARALDLDAVLNRRRAAGE